jgi:hypothetical protein
LQHLGAKTRGEVGIVGQELADDSRGCG